MSVCLYVCEHACMHACICMYMCVCVCIYSVCFYTERERDREEETDAQHTPSPVFPSLAALAAFLAAIAAFLCAAKQTKKRGHDDVHKQKQDAIETGTQKRTPTPDVLASSLLVPLSRLKSAFPHGNLDFKVARQRVHCSHTRPILPKPRPPKLGFRV